jgi:hypothetical protein
MRNPEYTPKSEVNKHKDYYHIDEQRKSAAGAWR